MSRQEKVIYALGFFDGVHKGHQAILETARQLARETGMRPLYGEGKLWIRPLSMWLEDVERDGKKQKRFTYIGE